MNKVAIVTGANGFIGKNIVATLLELDYIVYAVVSDPKPLLKYDCKNLHILNLLFDTYYKMKDLIKEDHIDFLIHCAWQGVWGKAFDDYKLQMENAINAGKTMDLAIELHCDKFVLLSTANVLETKKIILSPNEHNKLRSTTNYAMAKLSAEMICRTISSSQNIKFNCAYISMVFGEENYSMMVPNVVISKLLKGEPPNLIEGNGLYDLIYVKDVARGLVAISENGINMKSYYLGNRKLTTFKELFTIVGKIVNPTIELNFGAYPEPNYIDYSLVNLDELYNDTGFEPNNKEFSNNIIKTSVWIKANLL